MCHEAKTAISHARRTTHHSHAPQGWKPCSDPRGSSCNYSGGEVMCGLHGRGKPASTSIRSLTLVQSLQPQAVDTYRCHVLPIACLGAEESRCAPIVPSERKDPDEWALHVALPWKNLYVDPFQSFAIQYDRAETSLQPEYLVRGNKDPHLMGYYDCEELEDLPTVTVSHLSELPETSTFPDPYKFKAMLAGLVQANRESRARNKADAIAEAQRLDAEAYGEAIPAAIPPSSLWESRSWLLRLPVGRLAEFLVGTDQNLSAVPAFTWGAVCFDPSETRRCLARNVENFKSGHHPDLIATFAYLVPVPGPRLPNPFSFDEARADDICDCFCHLKPNLRRLGLKSLGHLLCGGKLRLPAARSKKPSGAIEWMIL
ncbi:hypothetical protein DFH06DRAFT_1134992 [Mycena polygramma]|nr:hypothetical protein DFH06DRAFT_1134992 [Mycena polygramma]